MGLINRLLVHGETATHEQEHAAHTRTLSIAPRTYTRPHCRPGIICEQKIAQPHPTPAWASSYMQGGPAKIFLQVARHQIENLARGPRLT